MLAFLFLEIDVGGGLNCAKVYSNDLYFFGDRVPSTLNMGKCMLQLQSWQPTLTFHDFLREGARIIFGK